MRLSGFTVQPGYGVGGSTAEADKGDTVVAAAAGTVAISAHQSPTNGLATL